MTATSLDCTHLCPGQALCWQSGISSFNFPIYTSSGFSGQSQGERKARPTWSLYLSPCVCQASCRTGAQTLGPILQGSLRELEQEGLCVLVSSALDPSLLRDSVPPEKGPLGLRGKDWGGKGDLRGHVSPHQGVGTVGTGKQVTSPHSSLWASWNSAVPGALIRARPSTMG